MSTVFNLIFDIFGINAPNIVHYSTFRFGLALTLSFILTMFTMPKFILLIRSIYPAGQPIRDLAGLTHTEEKKKSVTMGGFIVFTSTLVTILMLGNLRDPHMLVCILSFLLFSLIGLFDDILKIKKKYLNIKSLLYKSYVPKTTEFGISPKIKSSCQFLAAILIVFLFNKLNNDIHYTSELTLPFFKHFALYLGFFYTIFRILTVVGASNAVNITDGLDGLAIVPIILNLATFAIFVYLGSNAKYASYLFILHQPNIAEVFVLCGAAIGGCIGFLWYNIKPAQIFMGDVGSLGLGGLIGSLAVMTKNEVILIISGGIFVLETLSVIMQVFYFKYTKGKRIFKMAPIHHHFEIKGWSEMQVVVRFWIISAIFVTIALSSLKLR